MRDDRPRDGRLVRLCAMLKPGDPSCSRANGTPTEVENETVLLCGGGLGNAVLFSIARAFKGLGSKVLYFAGYKRGEDLFKQEEIEALHRPGHLDDGHGRHHRAEAPGRRALPRQHRPGDARLRQGGAGRAEYAPPRGAAHHRDRVGPDDGRGAGGEAGELRPLLDPRHLGIGSINSPMQCMMKEVCAQCLQKHGTR